MSTKKLLREISPSIAKKWDSSKNSLNLDTITVGSKQKCWWLCSVCGGSWERIVNDMVRRGGNCPYCQYGNHSSQERYLRFELALFLTLAPEETKIKINNRIYDVDIIVPELKLIIEYDGFHYHKNNVEIDTRKTSTLADAGWFVIRIRECSRKEKLVKITENDIIREIKTPLKEIANQLLINIDKKYNLDLALDEYLKKNFLVNRDAADTFILEQMIKYQEIKTLTNSDTIKASEIRSRILQLNIEEAVPQDDIILTIKNEYGIKINQEMIKNIIFKDKTVRKGIHWKEPEKRIEIEKRFLELITNYSIKNHDDVSLLDASLKEIVEQINDEFDVDLRENAIDKIYKKYDIRRKVVIPKITPQIKRRITDLGVDMSLTYEDIIKKIEGEFNLKISYYMCGDICREAGILRRVSKNILPDTIKKRILQLSENSSITQQEVALKIKEEFGIEIHQSKISKTCREAGIIRR